MPNTPRQEWELFKAFCLYYLTDHCLKPFCEMHDEWFKAIFNYNGCVVAAPRGFAKSSIFCFFLPLYLILTKKNITVALIGSSIKNIQSKWMVKIMDELETNKDILRDFGNQKTSMWSRETIKTATHNRLTPYGVDTKYRGERPNYLIIDDVENDINVRNPDQRKHVMDMFESAWFNSLTADGKLIIAGTVLHPLGFINTLIHAPYGKRVKWFREVYKGLIKDDNGNEVSAWPECYPTENLLMRRELSPAKFEQELQNNPLPDSLMIFQMDWIQYYNKLPQNLYMTTTVDPASSLDPEADETVICTCGTDSLGITYVAEVTHGHFLPDETTEHILRHREHWNSSRIGIESNGFATLKWYVEQKCRELRKSFPLEELKSGRQADAKLKRIIALQPFIKLGQIRFHKSQEPLVSQIINYPGKHDDLVDALAYQLELLRPGTKAMDKTYPAGSTGWLKQRFERSASRDRILNYRRWHK